MKSFAGISCFPEFGDRGLRPPSLGRELCQDVCGGFSEWQKIQAIATKIYGADGVEYTPEATKMAKK